MMHRIGTRGFTLLEIMIAVALLGIIGSLLAGTLSSSIDSKERVEEVSGRYGVIRQAMARMANELSMAYVSGQKSTEYVVVDTQFLGEHDKVSFVAFGGIARTQQNKQSDQREISYFLETDPDDGKQAIRRREHINPTKEIGKEGIAQTLLPDVVKFELDYFNDTDFAWQENWSTKGAGALLTLPSRVRIRITARMADDSEREFSTQAKIMLTQPFQIK